MHEPNLIPWIKYVKSSAFESVKNGHLNLERLSRSFRLAQPGILPLERLWFRRRTFHVPNLMHKLLQRIVQAVLVFGFFTSSFGSNWIKFVWINRRTFVSLRRSKFELKSSGSELGLTESNVWKRLGIDTRQTKINLAITRPRVYPRDIELYLADIFIVTQGK